MSKKPKPPAPVKKPTTPKKPAPSAALSPEQKARIDRAKRLEDAQL